MTGGSNLLNLSQVKQYAGQRLPPTSALRLKLHLQPEAISLAAANELLFAVQPGHDSREVTVELASARGQAVQRARAFLCANCQHPADEWVLCAYRYLVHTGHGFQAHGSAPWSKPLLDISASLCKAHNHGMLDTLDCLIEATQGPILNDVLNLRLYQLVDAAAEVPQ